MAWLCLDGIVGLVGFGCIALVCLDWITSSVSIGLAWVDYIGLYGIALDWFGLYWLLFLIMLGCVWVDMIDSICVGSAIFVCIGYDVGGFDLVHL